MVFVYLMGAVAILAGLFIILGMPHIPGPDWLKVLVVLVLFYKAAVSFIKME